MSNFYLIVLCIVGYPLGLVITAWINARFRGSGAFGVTEGALVFWPMLWVFWLTGALFIYPFAGVVMLIDWVQAKGDNARCAAIDEELSKLGRDRE